MTRRAYWMLAFAGGLLYLHGRRNRQDRGDLERNLQQAVESVATPLVETAGALFADIGVGASSVAGALWDEGRTLIGARVEGKSSGDIPGEE